MCYNFLLLSNPLNHRITPLTLKLKLCIYHTLYACVHFIKLSDHVYLFIYLLLFLLLLLLLLEEEEEEEEDM
jgi:hypothetical protein